ncbi:MAG TPA: response regulator [Candidatus Wunengus sp. YC60]|uniref:response regulator n=1 Tax=Candidatus Wunengus sp. YC60 TaxID=3367697 RepID=UPI0040251C8E
MAKILIVDDASFMRGSLKFIMESGGHEVVGMAKDGKEALEMYKKLKPDLVTLDILMREMDGITTLKELKKNDPHARVIMVSALGHEEKQKEASAGGALGFIRKPFKQDEILASVKEALGKK